MVALERILNPAMKSDQRRARRVARRRTGDAGRDDQRGSRERSRDARTLTLRLTKPVADFVIGLAPGLCAVPESLPVDPEGAKAPLPSPAPYFVAQYVPGERIVLERNRFYKGARPQHVDRFVVELGVDIATAFAPSRRRLRGLRPRPADLFRRERGSACATIRRQQGAVLRRSGTGSPHVRPEREPPALQGERQAPAGNQLRRRSPGADARVRVVRGHRHRPVPTLHDAGARAARIYPLTRPDLKKARALANGNRRSGRRFSTPWTPRSTCAGRDPEAEPRGNRDRARDPALPDRAPVPEAGDARRAVRYRPGQLGLRRPRAPRIPVRRADDRPRRTSGTGRTSTRRVQPEARSRVEAPLGTGARSRVRADRRRALTRCGARDSVRRSERFHAGLVAGRLRRRESVARLHRRLLEVTGSVERLDRDPDRVVADGDPGRTMGEGDGLHDLVGLGIDPRDRRIPGSRPRPHRAHGDALGSSPTGIVAVESTPCRSA